MTSIWEWKQEPASPLLDFEGDWYITGDNVAVEVKDYDDDTKPPSRAEAASKLLQDLDQWVKEGQYCIRICALLIYVFSVNTRPSIL